MPEPARTMSGEDDLMYSPPPPLHNLRWFALRSLDTLGRVLVGAFLCTLALVIMVLYVLITRYGTDWLFALFRMLQSDFP